MYVDMEYKKFGRKSCIGLKYLLLMIFSAGALSIIGCKKTPVIVVSGNVQEFYTGTSLSGVRITVSYSPVAFGTVSSGYQAITSTETDASGAYSIQFEEPTTATYRITARKTDFITEERTLAATDWSADEENLETFSLYKDVQLNLRFVKTSFDGSVLFQLGQHSENCTSCCRAQQSYFIDANDTTITCSVYGNQTIPYTITRLTTGAANVARGVLEIGDVNGFDESWEF